MPVAEKEFVLRHAFKDVSSMKITEYHYSEAEEHFGVPWRMSIRRNAKHLEVYLYCVEKSSEKWSIDSSWEAKVLAVTGKTFSVKLNWKFSSDKTINGWGRDQFIEWDELAKNYIIDDSIVVETHVKIDNMSGIEKKKLRNFDKSTIPLSDVMLVVDWEEFYVSKLFLAGQSTFFKFIILKRHENAGFPEHILKDAKPEDFQNFLELLYGESPIDESTIEGIVRLADMYDATIPIRKCEQFLIEHSEKLLKEKLKLAHRYNLENLKDHCLSKITSTEDIRSILTYDASEMDPSVVGALLQKSLSFNS